MAYKHRNYIINLIMIKFHKMQFNDNYYILIGSNVIQGIMKNNILISILIKDS